MHALVTSHLFGCAHIFPLSSSASSPVSSPMSSPVSSPNTHSPHQCPHSHLGVHSPPNRLAHGCVLACASPTSHLFGHACVFPTSSPTSSPVSSPMSSPNTYSPFQCPFPCLGLHPPPNLFTHDLILTQALPHLPLVLHMPVSSPKF